MNYMSSAMVILKTLVSNKKFRLVLKSASLVTTLLAFIVDQLKEAVSKEEIIEEVMKRLTM